MNHRIRLMTHASGTDSVGQPLKDWVQVAEVWGDVRFIKGVEAIRADTAASTVKASIRIRSRADVEAGWHAVYASGGRTWTFRVQSQPLLDSDPRFMFLPCEAVK
jgi:SPP1 family predicted phage head-tail adaptor